jgi:rubrerythrin
VENVKGSQTEKNLLGAFAGESQARNRYTYFASQAKKEGFIQVSEIFSETANQEKEHAKRFFNFLEGGDLEVSAESIAVAEKQHEKRYLDLAFNIESDRVFRRDGKVTWRCRNCGYLHEGEGAIDQCPACAHPQAYFELLGENY